ncbi:excinuclease ABC subunit UvrC, partial [Patescibacteria group bacterium]|nr:excinuclease ABC subunit UvrC [Patescibacteria group bacterium]
MKSNNKLTKILSNIPQQPGVYKFIDSGGDVLYIGKAKNLRNRVKSYFQNNKNHSGRIQSLVLKIEDIEVTVVSSELEAIILETNLIKEVQPRYNIMMRDDKNFVYIKITQNEDFPRIALVRKVLKDGALYFGPKGVTSKARKTLSVLKKIFPYRHCNLDIEEKNGEIEVTRKSMKYPCLDYHIKRCIAPCIGNCTKGEYKKIIDQIVRFLQGKTGEITEALAKDMQDAAANKQFERAAKLRDKLQAVEEISKRQVIIGVNREDIDAINYFESLGRIYFTLFVIRGGKLINQENFIFKSNYEENNKKKDEKDSNEEILEAFLKQYYEKTGDLPTEILLPHEIENKELIQGWLSVMRKRKVTLNFPQKGEKHKILKLAGDNAENFAKQSKVKWQTDEAKMKLAMKELQEKLDLKKAPRRMECYDISHISGTNQVASMVVFINGAPAKDKYRRFKIRTVPEGKPDDYTAMFEILKRRLLYLKESKTNVKLRKASKKDFETICKLIAKKQCKVEDYFKAEIDEKIVAVFKYEKLDDLEYFHDLNCTKIHDNLVTAFINKATKNRIYISIAKNKIEILEKAGFQKIKKLPDGIKVQKGNECLLLNKSKYAEEKSFTEEPELILIDGGKGQLLQGIKIMKEFGLNIPIASL